MDVDLLCGHIREFEMNVAPVFINRVVSGYVGSVLFPGSVLPCIVVAICLVVQLWKASHNGSLK
jgi:hypothetical protein